MDLFFAKIKGKVLILIQLVLKKSKQFIFIFQELELLSCHFNNYLSGIKKIKDKTSVNLFPWITI